jgi:hypothetical protein
MNVEALFERARAVHAEHVARHPWIEELLIVGVGWATVELDRAERELDGLGCPGWEAAPRDELLGASVRQCRDDGLQLLLLEPDTEGRLAASLARNDEGVAAVYLGFDRPGGGFLLEALSGVTNGPLGPARLLLGGPTWGPHAVVLEPDVA